MIFKILPCDTKFKNEVARHDGINFLKKKYGNIICKTKMLVTDYHFMPNM